MPVADADWGPWHLTGELRWAEAEPGSKGPFIKQQLGTWAGLGEMYTLYVLQQRWERKRVIWCDTGEGDPVTGEVVQAQAEWRDVPIAK